MAINFSFDRWEKVKEDNRRFWARELKRPWIQLTQNRGNFWGGEPAVRGKTIFEALYDFSIPVSEIVDYYDRERRNEVYLGDGFPTIWPNMGPGVVTAFCGGRVVTHPDTAWFGPPRDGMAIQDIHIKYDPANPLLNRVKDLYRETQRRWEGLVQVGMTDLGGNFDIVSAWRPGEQLLLDLYDNPAEAKRLAWEAHEAWWKCFEDINSFLHGPNPAYNCFCEIISTKPFYCIQCDFSYMIGPDMFDEFVKPELTATCRRLGNSIYHWDGVGALPHLDSLLSIKELDAIQWVYGTGKPTTLHWIDLYRRMREAGKIVNLYCSFAEFDEVVRQLGSAEGLLYTSYEECGEAEAREFLAKHGVR